jgi:hypothetical protein
LKYFNTHFPIKNTHFHIKITHFPIKITHKNTYLNILTPIFISKTSRHFQVDEYLTSQVDALSFAEPHGQLSAGHIAAMRMGGLKMRYHTRHYHWIDNEGDRRTTPRVVHSRAYSAVRPGESFGRDFNSGRVMSGIVNWELDRIQLYPGMNVMNSMIRRPWWLSPLTSFGNVQTYFWLHERIPEMLLGWTSWGVEAVRDFVRREQAVQNQTPLPDINVGAYLA